MAKPSLKRQLISSVVTVILIAALLIASVTSFAWFARSERVAANGLSVSLDAAFSDSQVRMCPVTQINGDEYEFLSDESVDSLPKYDKYNIDVSEYKRAVVLIVTFTAAVTNVDLSLSTSSLFDESAITGGTSDYLSNVVSFTNVGEVRPSDGSDTVKTAVSDGAAASFVSGAQNADGTSSFTKTNEISLLSDYYVGYSDQPHEIYLIMTYNTEVTEYLSTKLLRDVVFASDITIHLAGAQA